MNAISGTRSNRDFSDWAYLRGALAAAVCAYVLVCVAYPTLLMSPRDLNSLVVNALQPASLIIGTIFTSAPAAVGLMFLATGKCDHTTYRAAAIAGVKSASAFVVLVMLVLLGPGLIFALVSRPEDLLSPAYLDGALNFLWSWLIAALVGAVSGLAFRAVAGAPKVPMTSEG